MLNLKQMGDDNDRTFKNNVKSCFKNIRYVASDQFALPQK